MTTDQIREMLDAATDGPWEADIHGDEGTVEVISCDGVYGMTSASDARLIALAPELAQRVIDREAAIRRVRDIHEGIDALMNPGPHERLVKVCSGCGTDDGNWQRWPCPTIRALDGAGQ